MAIHDQNHANEQQLSVIIMSDLAKGDSWLADNHSDYLSCIPIQPLLEICCTFSLLFSFEDKLLYENYL